MSSRGMYSIVIAATATSAAADLLELTAADDKPLEICGIEIAQTTDFGDAQDEGCRVSIVRGNTTSGSGGSTPTPAPLDPNDGTASFSAEVSNTTVASSGTAVTLMELGWNVRAGYSMFWPEGYRPKTNQGAGLLCIRQAAPGDSLTILMTVWVREL